MVDDAINLPFIVDNDGVGCRKRLHFFMQVLEASISNFVATRKKRVIE
jgi:hypothetical protein